MYNNNHAELQQQRQQQQQQQRNIKAVRKTNDGDNVGGADADGK